MSPAELKMQPTIHFQSYESMMALLLIILFVTTDIYENVKIR
jgi:hypothetical protein